jgi:hypothetical protein
MENAVRMSVINVRAPFRETDAAHVCPADAILKHVHLVTRPSADAASMKNADPEC